MLAGLRNLLFRRRRERSLDAEIRGYEAMLREEAAARGLDAAAAARAAAVAMGGAGGVERVKEATRAARAGFLIETVARDIRFGARLLRRNPGVSALAILALALGIGANTALFSLVRGVLLQPLPYPQSDQLAAVFDDFAPQNNPHGQMCMSDFFAWRANSHAFFDPAIYMRRTFVLVAGSRVASEAGARATASLFTTLAVAPLLGRVLQPRDDRPGSAPVLVVSEEFWREQMGAAASAVGGLVKVDGTAYTVVGVMPAGFHFPDANTQIWANLPLVPPARLGPYFYRGVARLKPGFTLAQAQADTNRIARIQALAQPEMYRNLTHPVVPLREAVVGGVSAPLWVLLGAVGLVLLIAIVNVASLLLARAQARQGEIAVRISLGAGATRLLRQLLTESLLLALAGGAAGLGLAAAALVWLRGSNPIQLPRMADVHLDAAVLAWALGVSLAAGLLFGLAPGWQLARPTRPHGSNRRQRTRSLLVVGEIALAVVLLCGAGVLLHSLARLEQVDTGAHAPAAQIQVTTILLSGPRYLPTPAGADSPAGLAFDRQLLQTAQRFPGIQAAVLADALPPFNESDDDTFTIQGQPWSQAEFPSITDVNVSPGYFATMEIPLVAGRDFTADDTAAAPPVIIISQSVARHHFPGQNALGHYIKDAEPSIASPYARIVGVVGDAKYQGPDGSGESVYRPVQQSFDRGTQLLLRSSLPPAALAPLVRQAASQLEPEALISPTRSWLELESAGFGPQRYIVILLGVFALLALALAAIGIYGVIAYSVSRQTREIGVRMALGARAGQVLARILGQGLRLAFVGAAIGLGCAWLLTRLLAGLLFQTSPGDPLAFSLAALGLLAVAAAASFLPAWRAARIPPAAALRQH